MIFRVQAVLACLGPVGSFMRDGGFILRPTKWTKTLAASSPPDAISIPITVG